MKRTVSPPPVFWCQFLEWHLHASPHLAWQIWSVYAQRCDTATLWHLLLCSGEPTMERIARTAARVQPRDLMAASEQLTDPGQPRKLEVIAFQKRLLECLDATGTWR